MVARVSLLLGAAVLAVTYKVVSGLRANIAKARSTKLPYIVVRKSALERAYANPAEHHV